MAKWRAALSPALAALAAAIVSLPGLRLPFLSDDWAQIEATLAGVPCCTPFRDFRPVYMASLWLDRVLGGLNAARFHASNLLLIAGAAALVVLVVRRYTGDERLALATGLIFAVHPQHVENAAWVAGRNDPLFCVPYLLAMLAYDRWRARTRGAPWLTLLLYELALAAKETAVTLPLVLLVIGCCDARRRPGAAEWKRGLVPLFGLTVLHGLVLRTWFLG
ncbi:MAG TPA: hypothetical protein VNL37_08275, partial [Candidatus Polarisedimenticolia bacterium]|nr:hypothetical protein [Candidatus Polarisedimenticolia bacterium]